MEKKEIIFKIREEENVNIQPIEYEGNLAKNNNFLYFCVHKQTKQVFLKEYDFSQRKITKTIEIHSFPEALIENPLFHENFIFFFNSSQALDANTGIFTKKRKSNNEKVSFSLNNNNKQIIIKHWQISLYVPVFLLKHTLLEIVPLKKNEFLFHFRDQANATDEILLYSVDKNEFLPIESSINPIFQIFFSQEILILVKKTESLQFFLKENQDIIEKTKFSLTFEQSQNTLKFKSKGSLICGLENTKITLWSLKTCKKLKVLPLPKAAEEIDYSDFYLMNNGSLILESEDNNHVFIINSAFSKDESIKIQEIHGFHYEIKDFFEISDEFQVVIQKKSFVVIRNLQETLWKFEFSNEIAGYIDIFDEKGLEALVFITKDRKIYGFSNKNSKNTSFELFTELPLETDGEIHKLIKAKGNNNRTAYISVENGEIFNITLLENKLFSIQKLGKFEGILEESFIFEEAENFVLYKKTHQIKSSLIFLNPRLIVDFSISVLSLSQISTINDKTLILHDGLKIGQIAKFYRCDDSHCYCVNGEQLREGNCEKLKEDKVKKQKNSNNIDFINVLPYMLIIGGSLTFFFVWIIYNIKSTERELIKSIKKE